MATLTSGNHYLDEGTARTAGEAWTINGPGTSLTVRTDTRWHSNSPASMAGSLGSITLTEGQWNIDATTVRWLPINGGSGACAVGTTVSQGGVSGYCLGYWATLASAPSTTVGATGWLKFREVSGGNFASGALTGVTASATGPDVTGWIEVVCDQAANITVPRLGKFQTRGDWFYLDDTTGSVGQVMQLPTNGGGAGTTPVGAWIETGVGTNEYDHYPSLNGATNGWAYQHIGMPPGQSDVRQRFVKDIGSGQMQIGENVSLTGATYAGTAATTGTYIEQNQVLYYVWSNNEVTLYGTHYYETGESVGIDFPSGGPADGTYTITDVLGYQCFKVAATGSGPGNSCTCRSRLSLTVTASTINVADNVYCDFTTGTGVDGSFVVKGYNTTNSWDIHYPRTAALTVGNVSVYYGITVTTAAVHNLQIGHRVKLTFTSGTATTGNYTVIAIPTTSTFVVNVPFNSGTGGNCTVDFQLGFVPVSGCKVRVPNIFLRQCTTAARASNATPHATIASRPEFVTTSAGAIDIEYTYGDWYWNFVQPYSFSAKHNAISDTCIIQEVATAPVVDDMLVGMYGSLDLATFTASTLLSGCTFSNITAMRGNTPGTNDHAINISTINGGTFTNIAGGIIQYVRSSGLPISVSACNETTFDGITAINGTLSSAYGPTYIYNVNYCDRMTGWQGGAINAMSAVTWGNNPNGSILDGLAFGFNGTIPNQMPHGYIVNGNAQNTRVRNIGTAAAPLQGRSSFRPYAYGVTNLIVGSAFPGYKIQRVYVDQASTAPIYLLNSHIGMLVESVFTDHWTAGRAILYGSPESINLTMKGVGCAYLSGSGVSDYGVHFVDSFQRKEGQYALVMHEPTAATSSYYTVLSGNPRFNSAGGIVMYVVGDSAQWEDQYFRKGHTGFFSGTAAPIAWMDGGSYNYNYLVEYQIDKGTGFSGWKNFSRAKQITCSSGAYTATVADATGLAIGDYAQYYSFTTQHIAFGAKITDIVGNTLTFDKANFAAGTSQRYVFTTLPTETDIDPSIGFKLKIRITTQITSTVAINAVRARTSCTATSKAQCLYSLDVNTISFTGLPTGCDMVVLDAGTTNVLYQLDAYAGTTLTYTYEGADTIDVGFIKPGYVPYYIRNLALATTDSSIPVTLTADRNYIV
jgi:hypothetical protein